MIHQVCHAVQQAMEYVLGVCYIGYGYPLYGGLDGYLQANGLWHPIRGRYPAHEEPRLDGYLQANGLWHPREHLSLC